MKGSASGFYPISEDCGKLGILNLESVFFMSSYVILQSSKATAYIVSELFRDKQQGGGDYPSLNHFRVKSAQSTI